MSEDVKIEVTEFPVEPTLEELAKQASSGAVEYKFQNFYKEEDGAVECEVYDEELKQWLPYHAVLGDNAPIAKAIFAYMKANKIYKSKLEPSPRIEDRAKSVERVWRDEELSKADVIINKIEDFEIEGDSKPWRQYRVALRKWPDSPDFPSVKSRPTAPKLD